MAKKAAEEKAATVLSEAENVADRFRRQLASLQGDEARTAERIAKACEYFLPIMQDLGLKEMLSVEVDNTEVRTRLRRLAEDLIPQWQAHLVTLESIRDEGFEPSRYRQLRTMALLGEVKSARKARTKSPKAVADAGAADEEPAPERNLYEDNRHPELVEALRSWRLETARALGVPAYHVLHQKTLLGIADAAPATREDMLKVHGFGPRMWEKYGAEILEVMDAARQKG